MTYFSGLGKKIENKTKKPKMPKSKILAIIFTVVATVGYLGLFMPMFSFLKHFLVGTFGIISYVIFMVFYLISGMLLKGKTYKISTKYAVLLSVSLFCILSIFHMAFSGGVDMSTYGTYLADIYNIQSSIGGVLFGLVIYPFQKFLGIGAYFVFAIALVVCVTFVYNMIADKKAFFKTGQKAAAKKEGSSADASAGANVSAPANNLTINTQTEQNAAEQSSVTAPQKAETENVAIGIDAEIKKEETARDIARRKLGLDRNFEHVPNPSIASNQLDTFNKNYMNAGGSVSAKRDTQISSSELNSFGFNAFDNNSNHATSNDIQQQKKQEYFKFMGWSPDGQVIRDGNISSAARTSGVETYTYTSYTNAMIDDTTKHSSTEDSDKKVFGSSFDYGNLQNNQTSAGNVQQNNFAVSNLSATNMTGANNMPSATDASNFAQSSGASNININYSSPSEKIDYLDRLSSNQPFAEVTPNVTEQTKAPENNLNEIFDNNLPAEKIELPKGLQNNKYANLAHFDTSNKNPIDSQIARSRDFADEPYQQSIFENTYPIVKQYHYTKPTLDLLTCVSTNADEYGGNVEATGRKIEEVLEEFKIPAKIIGITRGPAVTRYELEMPVGISVSRIPALQNDIAMRIATSKKIMIQAPIPGMSAFGVEVPNDVVATVSLRDILSNPSFVNHKSPCAFALGKEINGAIDVCSVDKMPHVLIAGSTGSGKSVCLNSLILSILYKSSPEDVKFILIDPKRVEFSIYQGLPHLVLPDIISEPRKADNALGWAIKEMERRYAILEQRKVRKIDEYNNLDDVKNKKIAKMPYIIIIMDEFADMMQSDCKDIENKVAKLAAKARAAGIHLVLATQRPSVDVLSGTAKNNFPARIAFFLTTQTDSRTILGYSGAENLLGRGDMLYVEPGSNGAPKRVQGCFVSDEEVKRVVDFVIEHNKAEYDESIVEEINHKKETNSGSADGGYAGFVNFDDEEAEMESYAADVMKEFIRMGRASASYIQRIKRVGFQKASRIIDYLAKKKYISQGDGSSKPRNVYMTKQQYIEIYGDTDFDDHD